MNYWINIENLKKRSKKSDDVVISYAYFLYDFDEIRIYDKPKGYQEVSFKKFPNEIKPVEDALRYMNPGEEATLLVPSVLAFGTHGDGDKIEHDVPLIIKLKLIK